MPPPAQFNRASALCVLILQGTFALLILGVSAASVALLRDEIHDWNSNPENASSGHWDDSPAQYPYALSVICVAIATCLTFLLSTILVLKQKANPGAILAANVFWAICWLGLFAFGIYSWAVRDALEDCSDFVKYDCAGLYIGFAFFLLTPLNFLTTLLVIATASRALRRAKRGRGQPHLGAVPAQAQYYYSGGIAPFQQPYQSYQPYQQYPQYPQHPPLVRELNPQTKATSELHDLPSPTSELPQQIRSMNELPTSLPQPFDQNGQHCQHASMSAPHCPAA